MRSLPSWCWSGCVLWSQPHGFMPTSRVCSKRDWIMWLQTIMVSLEECTWVRLLAKIIVNWFKSTYEVHMSEVQYGFRENRSTSDGIFIVKMVVEKYGGPFNSSVCGLDCSVRPCPKRLSLPSVVDMNRSYPVNRYITETVWRHHSVDKRYENKIWCVHWLLTRWTRIILPFQLLIWLHVESYSLRDQQNFPW